MFILLKNDFEVDREKDKTSPSDQEITVNWISHCVSKAYANGIPADKRRLFNSMLTRMDKVVKEGSDYLELNSVEHEFLKKVFEVAVIDPKYVVSVTTVEESLLNPLDTLPA